MIGKRPRGRKPFGMLNEFLNEVSYTELKEIEKGGKQEIMENVEAKSLPNGITLRPLADPELQNRGGAQF